MSRMPSAERILNYRERLDQDAEWAWTDSCNFFSENNSVHRSLWKVAAWLDVGAIDYAVGGGLAMFRHGYRHVTTNLEILVTKVGLQKFDQSVNARDYVRDNDSVYLDAMTGVPIEFVIAGEAPRNRCFSGMINPHPADAAMEICGIQVLALPRLIEIELASGLNNPGQLVHIANVVELIKAIKLTCEFGAEISPVVRSEFDALCNGVAAVDPFDEF